MNVRFVSNKTKLAACLGISRTLLYEYFRLPAAPAPCADGRWSVPRMRKFIASHAAKVKAPNEAEALKIRKLTLQCEREQHELDTVRQKTRNEIRDSLVQGFVSIAHMIRSQLYQLRNQLAPRFEGKPARKIYAEWEVKEREMFVDVCRELQKRIGVRVEERTTQPPVNVIELNQRKGAAG